jgi:hypothetical protein
MKKFIVILVASAFLTGCMAHRAGEPGSASGHSHGPTHGLGTALGYLVASPVLILAGLFEGIATAPYLVTADLHEMNDEMERAGTDVTLDSTYRHAYGRSLASVPKSGSTGRVFRHMAEVTEHFQQVLRGYGVEEAESYVLTAVRTADRDGYTLYGLIQRPVGRIRIRDESGQARSIGPRDRAYYRPWARDAEGRPLDVVIDWAGVPRTSIKTQKGQAILLTLAANSVLINRRSDEYWNVEARWIAGGHETVIAERKAQLDKRMLGSG